MVRLIDLEDNADATNAYEEPPPSDDRPNPNLNQFTAALSCYPIVSQLAPNLDLNSLHELSRTCRQARSNLLQYRKQLILLTLRCANEAAGDAQQSPSDSLSRPESWTPYGDAGNRVGRLTSGKVGTCARDMVGDCRRCSRVVCRNCIIKAPPASILKGRHRRLCRTCIRAPLKRLTEVHAPIVHTEAGPDHDASLATSTRYPCSCQEIVWICQPCGQTLRPADTTYLRGWTWRTRYSACGGFGAGLGEGNEGVECGQMSRCLAARLVEKDVECDAHELAVLNAEMAKAEIEGRHWDGCSYSTQEIVGIGGRVKRKVRKLVSVGAIVKEYEDERGTEKFLVREQTGANRSWCSWCLRVVASSKDREEDADNDGTCRSSSSGSS